MGDKYALYKIACAYCGKKNDDVWYAESCGFTTFKCHYCGKENEIVMKFEAKKIK